MKHDEYHRQFADAIIEQIRQGTAPWQKPWGPGERVLPANVDTGRSYSGAATACTSPPWPAGARLRRRALGNLPPDPSPGRTGAEGRAGHPHPLVPGPPEDRRHRRARPAQVRDNEGKRVYRYERMQRACRPAVQRLQRRAGRRAAGPARARCRAALEGPPGGRTRPRGQRGPRPSRGGGPRVLQPEQRRDRAPGERYSSPRPTTTTRPCSTSWGTAPAIRSG